MSDLKDILSNLPSSLALSSELYVSRIPGYRRVWYCTNRAVRDPMVLNSAKFSGDRGEPEYGLCQVRVDPNRLQGQLTKKSGNFLIGHRIEKMVELRTFQQYNTLEMFLKLSQEHQRTRRRNSLLFVHGFNVSFNAAIERAAQLAEDLHISGEAFVFSWPSQDTVVDYVADQDRAEKSVDDLARWKELILEAMKYWGEHTLHVVAHSMGNRVLTPAVAKVFSSRNPTKQLGEVILAAADADIDKMEDWLSAVVPYANRVSIYASITDKALQVSARLHKSPRFGAMPTSNISWDVIHCGGSGNDWIKHSYIFETPAVLRDMEDVLNGRECVERHLISTRETRVWRLAVR